MKFVAAILLAITGSALAAPAAIPQLIHPNGNKDKCLTAASNANNAAVSVSDCTANNAAQLWTVKGTTITIYGDKCLDDTNGAKVSGNKLQIYTCFTGNTNQKWDISGQQVQLSGSNFCMDNTGGVLTNGNPTQIWTCTGGNNQKWTFETPGGSNPPPTGSVITPGKNDDVCLAAASNANNAEVTVETCNSDDPAQVWNVVDGSIKIFGDKCLDVPNGSTTLGTKLQIYSCVSGNTNQDFTVTGDKRIAWTNKGECMDLTDGNSSAGTQIQMWQCTNNNNNQVWNINPVNAS